MARTNKRFEDGEIAICGQPFYAVINGVEDFYAQGRRIRAPHPVLEAHPHNFARDGERWTEPDMDPSIYEQPKPPPEPPKPRRQVIATEDYAMVDPRRGMAVSFKAGDVFDADEAVVKAYPGKFRKLRRSAPARA